MKLIYNAIAFILKTAAVAVVFLPAMLIEPIAEYLMNVLGW